VILRLAVFTQYQSVTDTHTEKDGQIHDDGMYCVSIASHDKNRPYCTRPTKYNYYADNEHRLIANFQADQKISVISTYLNDNAHTPLNLFVVYMLNKQVCNRHGDKTNRWSLGLSLSVRGLKRRRCDQQSPSSAHLLIAPRQVARRMNSNSIAVHTKNGSREQNHGPFRGDLSSIWQDLILSPFVKKFQSSSFSHS